MIRISMQFFGADAGGGGGATETTGGAADSSTKEGAQQGTQQTGQPAEKQDDKPDLEKLVQARADKLNAESGKKIAQLQKELETLKREKMTSDELKQFEMSQKEHELAEREQALRDKENRLIAIKAIKEAGLDDGSENALELVDFVLGGSEEEIGTKVKAFSALVQKFVAAKVDKTFRENGRNPNNTGGTGNDNKDKDTSIAEKLGQARAEQLKKSRSILDKYTGR